METDLFLHYRLLERFQITTRHLSPIHSWLRKAPSTSAIDHKDIDLEGIMFLLDRFPEEKFTLDNIWQKPYLSWDDILLLYRNPRVKINLTLGDFCSHPYTPVSYLFEKEIFHPEVARNPTLTLGYVWRYSGETWESSLIKRNPGISALMLLQLQASGNHISPGVLRNPAISINDPLELIFPDNLHLIAHYLFENPSLHPEDFPKIAALMSRDVDEKDILKNPNIEMDMIDYDRVYTERNMTHFASTPLPLRYLREHCTFGPYYCDPSRTSLAQKATEINFLENLDLMDPQELLYSPYVSTHMIEDENPYLFWETNEYLKWEKSVSFLESPLRFPKHVRQEIFTLLLVLLRFPYLPPEIVEIIITSITQKGTLRTTLDKVLSKIST